MIDYTPEEKNKLAKKIIIIFGLIAGLGDTVYEGARGIYGIYLGILGMSIIMLVDMIFALPVAFMVFSESKIFIIIGIFICGIILAIQEVIFRAFIADEIGKENRGKAYGIYNVFYGLGILLGSSIIGFLYKNGAATIGFFCLTTQIAALLIFFKIRLINRD
ncbi:MFS transporter [Cetobacterium sp. 2A]|uniref:MFS transporter n=1 Tax=unclassified Cetobacterium TaxID=2630983 RepID=UPI00163C31AC|nr:MFS transporter [Cetobacterium sp. 2A]MBC2857209.1 MFS transporter [Cetobacterium sp. 2A]